MYAIRSYYENFADKGSFGKISDLSVQLLGKATFGGSETGGGGPGGHVVGAFLV